MFKYQIYKIEDSGERCWCWKLLDDRGETVAHSEERFLKESIVGSIKDISVEVVRATICLCRDKESEDKEQGCRFEYYKADDNWQWRFCVGSQESIVIGDIQYNSEDEIKEILELVKKEMADACIEWQNLQDDPGYQDKRDDCTETRGIPGS